MEHDVIAHLQYHVQAPRVIDERLKARRQEVRREVRPGPEARLWSPGSLALTGPDGRLRTNCLGDIQRSTPILSWGLAWVELVEQQVWD